MTTLVAERRVASRRHLLIAFGLAVVLVVGMVVSLPQLFVLELALIMALYATSTNFLLGSAGVLSLGQAAFFGAGAYAMAYAVKSLGILGAIGCAVVVGLVVSLVVSAMLSRISGIAFAMATLAFGQLCYTFANQSSLLGGSMGVSGFMVNHPGYRVLWLLLFATVCLAMLAFRFVDQSNFGLALRALRDDSVRLLFLGINLRTLRIKAFLLASCGASLAGALYALTTQTVGPQSFSWLMSGDPIIMSVLGGSGYFIGPTIGAVAIVALRTYVGDLTQSFEIVIGVAVVATVLLFPGGIAYAIGRVADRLIPGRRGKEVAQNGASGS